MGGQTGGGGRLAGGEQDGREPLKEWDMTLDGKCRWRDQCRSEGSMAWLRD